MRWIVGEDGEEGKVRKRNRKKESAGKEEEERKMAIVSR